VAPLGFLRRSIGTGNSFTPEGRADSTDPTIPLWQPATTLLLAATVGSTIQMVLLVAPLLVFSGMALGQPLDLCFSMFEVVAIVLTIFLTREIIADGRTTWIEGVLLLATYAILVIGFYHLPDATLVDGQDVLPLSVR